MIEALKSILRHAAQIRGEGKTEEAERLYREVAEEAKAQDAVVRAEALMGTAQTRRDRGDRIGASIFLSEAITLLRNTYATHPEQSAHTLAHALRHAAEIRSELSEFAAAGSHIQDAVRLYRALDPASPLDLANALRVAALNDEREAAATWAEAETLYAQAGVHAGVEQARIHLDRLNPQKKSASSSATQEPANESA